MTVQEIKKTLEMPVFPLSNCWKGWEYQQAAMEAWHYASPEQQETFGKKAFLLKAAAAMQSGENYRLCRIAHRKMSVNGVIREWLKEKTVQEWMKDET